MSEDVVAPVLLRSVTTTGSSHRLREVERTRDPRAAYRLGSALARRANRGDVDVAAEAEQLLRVALDAGIEEAARELAVLLMLHDGRVREGLDLLVRARAYGVSGAQEILRMLTEEDNATAHASA